MADATPRPHLWESVVYGPLRSRRLGVSLGLNLTPRGSKLCDFNCPYCACGRVAVLSNGRAAAVPAIRDALRRLDARIMKLDPGPPERVNDAVYEAARLAAAYHALQPVTVQATVVRGPDWDGSSPASLAAWLPLLLAADPAVVQLCSLDRPPADPRILNVPRERLLAMAAAIREALPRSVVDVY